MVSLKSKAEVDNGDSSSAMCSACVTAEAAAKRDESGWLGDAAVAAVAGRRTGDAVAEDAGAEGSDNVVPVAEHAGAAGTGAAVSALSDRSERAIGMVDAARAAEPVATVRAASYARGTYRSFEFVDLSAHASSLTVLLSGAHAAARDLLLALAGAVRPTSGTIAVDGISFNAGASTSKGPLGGALAWHRFGRYLRAHGAVGLGIFTGLTDVDAAFTVEEAVSREMRAARHSRHRVDSNLRANEPYVLGYLARCGLATHADQHIERLEPAARARLSAALALATRPRLAVIDLRDACCAGLTADEERAVAEELRTLARETGAAVLAACAEVASAQCADAAYTLDIAAAEALGAIPSGASTAHMSSAVSHIPVSSQEVDA